MNIMWKWSHLVEYMFIYDVMTLKKEIRSCADYEKFTVRRENCDDAFTIRSSQSTMLNFA